MRHYWLMYQIALKNIFENGMIPKLMQKRPTTVWNIYFGPIEQNVCLNTTEGDQQK